MGGSKLDHVAGTLRSCQEVVEATYLRRDRERCVGIQLIPLRGAKAGTYFRLSLSHPLLGFGVLFLCSRVKAGKNLLDLRGVDGRRQEAAAYATKPGDWRIGLPSAAKLAR
jgi:hypothetical protein